MAVYTELSLDEIRTFLQGYDVPALASAEGIRAGVENTNYRLKLADGSEISAEFIEAKFSTDFQNEKNVKESVSSMKEPDGTWRVIAYDARTGGN